MSLPNNQRSRQKNDETSLLRILANRQRRYIEERPYQYNQTVNWFTKSYRARIPKQQFWYKNMFENKMVDKDWFKISTCCKIADLVEEARRLTYRDSRVQFENYFKKYVGGPWGLRSQIHTEMKDNVCLETN